MLPDMDNSKKIYYMALEMRRAELHAELRSRERREELPDPVTQLRWYYDREPRPVRDQVVWCIQIFRWLVEHDSFTFTTLSFTSRLNSIYVEAETRVPGSFPRELADYFYAGLVRRRALARPVQ
jgi:hypothetical protein